MLDVESETPAVSVQVYYDQGFTVPAADGRGAGRDFLTVIGNTGGLGSNDLVLMSQQVEAQVTVADLDTGEVVFHGPVARGTAHVLTLHTRYLHITSDHEITAMVAPGTYAGYAEHHYAAGAEGMGIDNDFLLPTPGQLWIFSYFANNVVTVEDTLTGREVYRGTLGAGHAQPLASGQGIFRVHGTGGMSVMGGDQACGAEFSPAGRLFQVDEALLRAVVEIRQQRREQAAARGETLTPAAASAPLSPAELGEAARRVNHATGSSVYDAAAMEQRLDEMNAH